MTRMRRKNSRAPSPDSINFLAFDLDQASGRWFLMANTFLRVFSLSPLVMSKVKATSG